MKSLLIGLVMVLVVVGLAMAQESTSCYHPQCPQVEITCQCNCVEFKLPGLYQVVIDGIKRCGEVTVISTGLLLYEGGVRVPFPFNKPKRLDPVESCD